MNLVIIVWLEHNIISSINVCGLIDVETLEGGRKGMDLFAK